MERQWANLIKNHHHAHLYDEAYLKVDEKKEEGYIVAGSVRVSDESSGCRVFHALAHSTHPLNLVPPYPFLLSRCLF